MESKNTQKEHINQFCRKHPSWRNLFLEWLENDSQLDTEMLAKEFKQLTTYHALLKDTLTLSFVKETINFDDSRHSVEQFHDLIHKTLHSKKKESFIKSLTSLKDKHLIDDSILSEIHSILDCGVDQSTLKHQFFNKLAAYKTSDDLLTALQSFKAKQVHWDKEHYLNIIKNLNAVIIEEYAAKLIVQVNDYEACKALGPQAWCIVREQHYFNTYTKECERQIIVLDFSKKIDENTSIIGFSVDIKGISSHSFLKDDKPTPLEITKDYQFEPISTIAISNFLNNSNIHDAFEFICKHRLTNFYKEYLDKITNCPNYKNKHLLMHAVRNGFFDIVYYLLSFPKVTLFPYEYEAILSFAVIHNNIDIIDFILPLYSIDNPRFAHHIFYMCYHKAILIRQHEINIKINNTSFIFKRFLNDKSFVLQLGKIKSAYKSLTDEDRTIYLNTLKKHHRKKYLLTRIEFFFDSMIKFKK